MFQNFVAQAPQALFLIFVFIKICLCRHRRYTITVRILLVIVVFFKASILKFIVDPLNIIYFCIQICAYLSLRCLGSPMDNVIW